MSLTLKIVNVDRLENGERTSLRLDRRGALIGRLAQADWVLPDPTKDVSTRHCEIEYRDGNYIARDVSTNGTFLNNEGRRMDAAHVLRDGDQLSIGRPNTPYHYIISVSLSREDGDRKSSDAIADDAIWLDSRLSPPPPVPPPPQIDLVWTSETPSSAMGPSGHSAPPSQPSPTQSAEEIWGALTRGHEVDLRGLGSSIPNLFGEPNSPDIFDLTQESQTNIAPQTGSSDSPPRSVRKTSGGAPDAGWEAFLGGAGLKPEVQAGVEPVDALRLAGDLLRRMTAGMVLMLEARAKAKHQLGAQATNFDRLANPLKYFARAPEQALSQLLGKDTARFMPPARAVEDGFQDLQNHQMATLQAMKGALAATLDRFSPQAIRKRGASLGVLGRVLPFMQEAQLWRRYEREFEGVARGADEAFMEVFAREFRQAYERAEAMVEWRK